MSGAWQVVGIACERLQQPPSADSQVRRQRVLLYRRKWRHRTPVAVDDVGRRWRRAAVGSASEYRPAALQSDDLAVLRLRRIYSDASLPCSFPLKQHHQPSTNQTVSTASATTLFFYRASAHTRDIDIAILSVHPFVCHVPVLYRNDLAYHRTFFSIWYPHGGLA